MQNDQSHVPGQVPVSNHAPRGVAVMIALVAVMVGLRLHHESSERAVQSSANAGRASDAAQQTAPAAVERLSPFGNVRPFDPVADGQDAVVNPVASILRDWQQRRERAPVIRYQLTGKRLWPRGSFAPDPTEPEDPAPAENPVQDVFGSCTRTTLFDFPRNRFRIEFDNAEYDHQHRQTYRVRCLEVGDGTALRVNIFENSTPRPGDTRAKTHVDFWIARGEPQIMPPGILGHGYEPMFFAAGIVPAQEVRIRPLALVPTNDPGAFTFAGRTNESDRTYAILRDGNKEYWVDTERDSAIVKMVLKEQMARRVVYEIEIDYQETPGGWLPRSWTRTEFRLGKMVNSERIEVERIDVLPPVSDQDFILEATAGMYVKDERYRLDVETGRLKSDAAHYRLETDGRKTDLNENLIPLGP